MVKIDSRPKCPKCGAVDSLENYRICNVCGINVFSYLEKQAEKRLRKMLKDEKKMQEIMNRPDYQGPRFA